MKRDPDLIRKILIEIERGSGDGYMTVTVEGYSEEEINYHLSLLNDAGFIVGVETRGDDKSNWMVSRLTWSGHEFLEAASDDTRWNTAKEIMARTGGFALDVMKAVLIDLLKKQAMTGL